MDSQAADPLQDERIHRALALVKAEHTDDDAAFDVLAPKTYEDQEEVLGGFLSLSLMLLYWIAWKEEPDATEDENIALVTELIDCFFERVMDSYGEPDD